MVQCNRPTSGSGFVAGQSAGSKRSNRLALGAAALARALCDVYALLAAGVAVWLLATRKTLPITWPVAAALATLAFFSSLFIAVHLWRHWAQPIRALQNSLAGIRSGQVPIDQADAVGGGLQPLAAQLQDVLRELRSQRAHIAMLEQEMSHRVARRTDALERVVGSLRQQVGRDPLTGLQNRRVLDDCLAQLMDRSRAEDWPLCILMIDIDDFKHLNDTLGHTAGDELLRALGQIIRSNLRDKDVAFRVGGDEFVVLLANTTRHQAQALARRLVSLVDALAKTLDVSPRPRLSIGLAMPQDLGFSPTPAALLAQADRLLYLVKAQHKHERMRNVA